MINLLENFSSTKMSVPGQLSDDSSTENLQKFNILPSPVKSSNDKNEYKIIRLKNGLTACLISDPSANQEDVASVLSKENSLETETECNADDMFGSGTESIELNDEEENEEIDNSVQMKKDNVEGKLAAAALCVGVGCFSDPKDVPGLAHFLEHMVFMGSEKYPQENDFHSFIQKHGGSDNAFTEYEMTTFYFECFEKHLFRSMDKFAQFFISPLLNKEAMTREREAIDSEFQMALPSDAVRTGQFLINFASQSSPVNTFCWGNLVTLKENIADDRLYELLHDFRKRHYSAHRMTLAVQARLPMDLLESYVINCFSDVPNNDLPPIDFKSQCDNIFNIPSFTRLYYMKPLKDLCQVQYTWILPAMQDLYKSKPILNIAWILEHEGKGSLLSYLKKKVWALYLYAGNGGSGGEYNSLYSCFVVTIVLTNHKHIKEVTEAMFGYLNLLRKHCPNERIFKEIQLMSEVSFRFENVKSACDRVTNLVQCMQNYPSEDYLTCDDLLLTYNPDAIRMVLNNLVPGKMHILLLSSDVPEDINYDKVEPWFKTQYTDRDIPSDWMECWLNAEPLPDFAIPEPNRFFTEDFSLLPKEETIPAYPEKILQTALIELWYKKDEKFNLPKAYYYYHLITPYAIESAKSFCMMEMFVKFVNLHLAEEGYAAQLAELAYSISLYEKGIYLMVCGYNEKLPMLLRLIIKHFNEVGDTITIEVFEAIKEKGIKAYYNAFLDPLSLCSDIQYSIIQNKYYTLLDKHAALLEITFDMLKDFTKVIFKNLYIQGLVQGNVSCATVLEATHLLIEGLHCEPLMEDCRPKITMNEMPNGEYCCRVMSFDKDNANSVVQNYYQCGIRTIKDKVTLEFILLLIDEPLFNILRTREQLGYHVYSVTSDVYDVLGYIVGVNFQADKFTTQYVDVRIEAFLKRSSKLLKRMTYKKFLQTQKDLIKIKQQVDVNLDDEVGRNWSEIVNERYNFDIVLQEIEACNMLRMREVRKWWDEHNVFNKSGNFKKLSMQVVGHANVKGIDKTIEIVHAETTNDTSVAGSLVTDNGKDEKSELSNELNSEIQDSCINKQRKFKMNLLENHEEMATNNRVGNYFITNIGSFKSELNMYCNAKK